MKRYEGSPAVVIERRKGTPDSPFSNMNESLVVAEDGKVLLSEIPNELNRVVVTGDNKTWYEVKQGELTDNAFKVDYINKLVTFNIIHVGKQLHFKYVGEGNHYYSPHSIYTKLEDGDVIETLGDLIEGGSGALDGLVKLDAKLAEADQAIVNANTATQGANTATSNANQAIANVNGKIVEIDGKITESTAKIAEVDGKLLEATNTINDIKQQSTAVQDIINNGQDVIDSAQTIANELKSVGTFNLSTVYKKNNTVLYNGSSWIALQNTQNNPLPVLPIVENTYWRLSAIHGEKGLKGDTGAALSILDKLTDVSQLPPTGEAGNAYTVNGELYVWSENINDWINVGNIKGEKGDKGDKGEQGIQGEKGLDGKDFDINTIPDASPTQRGLMSEAYALKLSGIQTGANHTTVEDILTSDSPTNAVSAKQAKALSNQIGILTDDLTETNTNLTMLDGKVTTHLEDYNQLKQNVINHINEVINSENGAHKLRYFNDKLEFNDGAGWNEIETGSATPKVKIYGVKIDTTNSNPETALTYTDDAIGFTPASGNNSNFSYGSWEDKFPFNQIKPCLFNNGLVVNYLNPNNYNTFVNGADADIVSGNSGDVMVEFPKIYWKIETVGTDVYIRYSDVRADNSYRPLAHTRLNEERDFIYISAYLGFTSGTKLKSLSQKTPGSNQNITTFRNQSKANGLGYDQIGYNQILMLQVLFTVMFKDINSQSALGMGYTLGNSTKTLTGYTDDKGLFYGEDSGKLPVKFCGIEDFWGNLYYWVDGLYTNANTDILIGNDSFNNTGSGYTNYGKASASSQSGFLSSVQGTTEAGFIGKVSNGSTSTYYCDMTYISPSYLPRFGGSFAEGNVSGAFAMRIFHSATSAYADTGARIMYL